MRRPGTPHALVSPACKPRVRRVPSQPYAVSRTPRSCGLARLDVLEATASGAEGLPAPKNLDRMPLGIREQER